MSKTWAEMTDQERWDHSQRKGTDWHRNNPNPSLVQAQQAIANNALLQESLQALSTPKAQALLPMGGGLTPQTSTGGNAGLFGVVRNEDAQAAYDTVNSGLTVDSYDGVLSDWSYVPTDALKDDALAYFNDQGIDLVNESGNIYASNNDIVNNAVWRNNPDVDINQVLGVDQAGYVSPQEVDNGLFGLGISPYDLALGVVGAVALPGISAGLASTGAGALASNAAAGGIVGGTTAAMQDQDILEGIVTGGVSGALSAAPLSDTLGNNAFTNLYDAQNVGGAFVQGATNDAVMQAIRTGDIDLGDAAKAGLINTGAQTLFDLIGDANQTKDGSITDDTTVDGVRLGDMSPSERQAAFDRLSNSSDLYGTLGPGGLIDRATGGMFTPGYIPTDYIGDALNYLGFGDPRQGVQAAYDERAQRIEELSPELSPEQRQAAIDDINQSFYSEIQPYDEREFIINQPRGNSELSGIWEFNDVLPSSSSDGGLFAATVGGGFRDNPLSSSENTRPTVTAPTQSTPEKVIEERGFGESSQPPPPAITDNTEELVENTPSQPSDNTEEPPIVENMFSDVLVPGPDAELSSGQVLSPSGPPSVDSDNIVDEMLQSSLTGSTGGGGNNGRGRGGNDNAEWEDFMMVPQFSAELYSRLGIPTVDYTAGLFR